MVDQELEKLKYPIGNFQAAARYTPEIITECISHIETLADKLIVATEGLSDEQLDTPYRPDGWTIRQVVHHLADSHMNSYMRFKLALTETNPTIRPYNEVSWAEEPEAKHAPIGISLDIIKALHKRWVIVLRNMNAIDFENHITSLKARMNW